MTMSRFTETNFKIIDIITEKSIGGYSLVKFTVVEEDIIDYVMTVKIKNNFVNNREVLRSSMEMEYNKNLSQVLMGHKKVVEVGDII